MRLGFIGGSGHHNLRGWLRDADNPFASLAVSGDGHDDAAARRMFDELARDPAVDVKWFDTPTAMLDTFKPSVVSIGAVYGYNGDMTAAALERSVPTVCEKPIAATWAQLARLERLADKAPLVTEFGMRSDPSVRAARGAVAQGLIGAPVLAVGQKSYRFGTRPEWYARRADFAGTLLWVASHAIDTLYFITGRRYVSVSGRGGNLSKPDYAEMEDHTAAVFELEGGGTAVVHADYLNPVAAPRHDNDRYRIAGTSGIIDMEEGKCWITTNDQPRRQITGDSAHTPTHREMLDAALGKSVGIYGTDQSLYMARVLLHARDAADHGRVERIA